MKKTCDNCSITAAKAFLLTLFSVFLAHYLSDISGIEKMTITEGIWGWVALFAWYLAFMFVGLKIADSLKF